MFYSPFRFRHQKEYCSPRGPNFSQARKIHFTINDSKIILKVPKHKTNRPIEQTNPKKVYELSSLNLREYRTNEPDWNGLALVHRAWDFYGPWFTGKKASIEMSLDIISPRNIKEEVSFFHPRAFESGLIDFLTYRHGKDISFNSNEQRWHAPVNWKPISSFPCVATSFDIVANQKVNVDDVEHCLFFPISQHHMVALLCYVSRNKAFITSNNIPEPDTDKWIDKKPMEKLASQVIESVQVQLSSKALEQQKKALQGLEDTSLVKDFPPIRWA